MNPTRRDIPTIVFLVIACVFAAKSCQTDSYAAEMEARVDSIRSVELLERVEAAGWEAQVAEVSNDLNAQLQAQRDTSSILSSRNADLAAQVDLLGGRVREITSMYASAVGQIEAHGEVHTSDTASAPDSITANVDDGLLSGRLVYRRASHILAIDPYGVHIGLTTGIVELPNGQWTAIAQADDPRVVIGISNTLVDPPAPVPYCSLMQKGKFAAYGAGAVAILGLLFPG